MSPRARPARRPQKSPSLRRAAVELGPVSNHVWRPVLLLAAIGALVYANTLTNPLVLDDESTVVENQQIRDLTSAAVLTPERELPVAGRPVVNVSFALNYMLGGLNLIGYRVVNIAIHVTAALLLFGIVRRTLEVSRHARDLSDRSTYIAFAVALLWLVHPLNTDAVSYLTQRTESMMGMFYLLALYASLRAASPA
jgi:hypothetical protein